MTNTTTQPGPCAPGDEPERAAYITVRQGGATQYLLAERSAGAWQSGAQRFNDRDVVCVEPVVVTRADLPDVAHPARLCGTRFMAGRRIWECNLRLGHGGEHQVRKPPRPPSSPSGISLSADGKSR